MKIIKISNIAMPASELSAGLGVSLSMRIVPSYPRAVMALKVRSPCWRVPINRFVARRDMDVKVLRKVEYPSRSSCARCILDATSKKTNKYR